MVVVHFQKNINKSYASFEIDRSSLFPDVTRCFIGLRRRRCSIIIKWYYMGNLHVKRGRERRLESKKLIGNEVELPIRRNHFQRGQDQEGTYCIPPIMIGNERRRCTVGKVSSSPAIHPLRWSSLQFSLQLVCGSGLASRWKPVFFMTKRVGSVFQR